MNGPRRRRPPAPTHRRTPSARRRPVGGRSRRLGRHRRRTPQGRGGRRGSRTRDCSTRRVRASRARGARRHHHRWGTGPGRRLDRRLGRQRSGRPARSRSVCAAGLDDADPAEIRELVRRALVQEGGVVFAASAIDEAARVVARLLADQPDGITVAEARDAWGTAQVRDPVDHPTRRDGRDPSSR